MRGTMFCEFCGSPYTPCCDEYEAHQVKVRARGRFLKELAKQHGLDTALKVLEKISSHDVPPK
jgi:hypothetical protein